MHNNDILKFQYNQLSCKDARPLFYGQMTAPSFRGKCIKMPESTEKQMTDEAIKVASAATAAASAAGLVLFHMNGKKKIFDHEALAQEIQRQLNEGIHYKQICVNLGISEPLYCTVVTEFDIKTERRKTKENSKAVNEEEFRQMVAEKVPVKEIREHFHISRQQYLQLLKQYEIKSAKMLANERVENITKEEVEEAIKSSSLVSEACRKLEVSEKTYKRLKKKFGIDYDPINPNANFHNLTDEEIKELAESDESVTEKSQKYGVTPNTYHNELRIRNVSTRNKEAMERYDSLDVKKLQADIDAKVPKKKLLEVYGISLNQFQRLLDEGLIITPQKAMRDRIANMTDEKIQEALNNSKNIKEAAKQLEISKSELVKLIHNRDGVTNPRNKNAQKQEYQQEFVDSFTQDVLSDMTINEVCDKYQISQDKYYKLINEFKIETQRMALKRKLAEITTEQILQAINDADTHKEIYNNIGISKNTYSRLLKRHRIITEHQRALKRISEISKEQLIEGILDGKPVYQICKELDINLPTCYALIKQYNINYSKIAEKAASKEYEKYDVNTLKDCAFNLLMENNKIYNDEELSSILEFAFEREYKTEEERQELVSLLRIINNVSLGNITPEQALNRAELKQQLAEIEYTDSLADTLQAISELFRIQKDGASADICLKYIPKSYSDTEKAKEVIELIKSNINYYEQNKEQELKKIKKILVYFDLKDNAETSSIIDDAKQIYGEDNQEKIGQYIIFDQALKGEYTNADFNNDAFLFVDKIKDMHLNKDTIIKRLIELEDYFNSKEAKNNSLTNFIKHFNSNDNYINKLLTDFYIDNIYKDKITTIEVIPDSAYFSGKNVTLMIYPEAKQATLENTEVNINKHQFLIDSEEYARNFANRKLGSLGVKIFTLDKSYQKEGFYSGDNVLEIKVPNGHNGARLAAKIKNEDDKVFEIRYFMPKGFHKEKKRTDL